MSEEARTNRPRKVQFGVYEADLTAGELRRSGIKVRLQSQPFKLLAALLERPGELVTREELQQLLWGAETTVDYDHSLGIAVNKLRDALNDSAENPRFVETLAKRGYRFIAPVVQNEPVAEALIEPTAAVATVEPAARRQLSWQTAVIIGLVLLSTGLGLAVWLRPAIRKPYAVEQVVFSGKVLANETDVESFSASASDGTRLYFANIENGMSLLSVALTANGEVSHFDLPSEVSAPLIGSLSPDGSKLIVHGHLQASPEQPLWIVPTLGGSTRRVPKILAHDATWMPDGQRLLAASGNELVIVNEDGSDAHRLTTVPGLAFWLRWSPNGKVLRFTLRDQHQQTNELWEVRADGSHLRPVLPNWNHPAAECCGNWTSDGQEYVFESWHGRHSEIWAMHQNWLTGPSQPRPITSGPLDYQAPSTSPGSHLIYFVGVHPKYELLQKQNDSSAFKILENGLNSAALVTYSPDGKWVAWLNTSDGSLWRSKSNGTERIELTAPPLRIFSMRWSPDDQHLVLMALKPGKQWKIYEIDADGGQPVELLHEDRNEADPNLSDDGRQLVFGRLPDRMDTERQPKAIYLLDMGTHQVSEVAGSTGLFSPRLSPDGKRILAIRLDQHAMLLYERATGKWTTLTTHGVGDPFWSRDGKYIYFQDFMEQGKPIYRLTVGSNAVEKIVSIDALQPISATDYRLIGLAPGDLPIVGARTSEVNLYSVNLDQQ